MSKLRISQDLALPIDAVTQRISILGRTRSGKSHTAGVIVEEALGARQQVVIVDPKGDWWGLRSSADGRSAGLPITIMGGKRGDVPLEPTAGALVADIAVDEGVSLILDLSLFESKAAEVRFMEAFLDRLYRRNERPLLLVVDESDVFAPQRPERNETTMLNRMETVCRRGASKGIGVLLVSQRSASIHKGCLSQTELMVAHQTTAPQDRKAIREWAEGKGTEEQQRALMGRLAGLKTGVAVVWSPAWLDLFAEVAVRPKHTFDSGATPRVGMRRRKPRILAPVDIERLKRHMAETIQKMRAEDPRLLREEVARLKADLAKARTGAPKGAAAPAPPPRTVVTKVEVPVLSRGLERRLAGLRDGFRKAVERASGDYGRLEAAGRALASAIADLVAATAKAGPRAAAPARQPAPAAASPAKPAPPRGPGAAGNGDDEGFRLNSRHLDILKALALFRSIGREGVPRAWVAAMAGVSHRSSGYEQNVGQAKRAGCLEYGEHGTLRLTAEGLARAGVLSGQPTTDDLLRRCLDVVSAPQAELLRLLHEAYPHDMTREELATRAGKSPTSSGFEQNVGILKRAGMAEYPSGKRVRRAGWISVDPS